MAPRFSWQKALLAGLLLWAAAMPATAGDAAFEVGPGVSGAFFDVSHDGEGFIVEVFEDGTALVYWFTYTAAGEQRWFFGVGRVEGDRIVVDELLASSGGGFGDDFDPDSVEFTVAGSITLSFSGCDAGRADYVIDGVAGEQILARLAMIAGLGCDGPPADMPAGYSGSFGDPLFNGQGFIVQVLSATEALVVWFTYDSQGNQAWVFGVGTLNDGIITVNDAVITSGGLFGPDFDPADVERNPWGAFELDLVCGGGLMNYQSALSEYGAGYQQPLRITALADAACERERMTDRPVNCGTTARTALRSGWLDNGTNLDLVDNSAYLPAANCKVARHEFSGTLTVAGGALSRAGDTIDPATFPGFSADFITVGSYLLPVERNTIVTPPGNYWNITLSPGRVWRENGDGGRSRASFPFILTTNVWNQAHNGIATFLYDDASVTGLRLQIVQETAAWSKADYWGQMPASSAAKAVPGAEAAAVRFERELTRRYTVRDWSELEDQVGAESLSTFTRFQSPTDVSLTGLAVDDMLYLKPADTRSGPYPYPEEMRSGVYSVTKTSAAALALLWLAQTYGEEVFDLRIRDYLNVTASHNGWDEVTFAHAIDMMTGIGNNSPNPNIGDTFADETALDPFGFAPTTRAKLDIAFAYGNYPWGPGEIVRYNSTHTFVLGAAMDAYYKSMEGPDADLWQSVIERVFIPMGLQAVPMLMTRELIAEDRLPVMAWGRYLTADDAMKIARLFQNDGRWGVRQLLHPGRTREALRVSGPAPWPTSLRTELVDSSLAPITYKYSVWGFEMPTDDCTVAVNFMWGYGGNYVLMMPNNVTAFIYADGFVFDVPGMAWAAHQVRSLC